MTKFLNLTPHDIVVEVDGKRITFPASGDVARLDTDTQSVGEVGGIPAQTTTLKGVVGIPSDVEGKILIVSSMLLDAVKALGHSVVAPATGPKDGVIRNDKGHIEAVTRFNV